MEEQELSKWQAIAALQADRINAALWDRGQVCRVSPYQESYLGPRHIIHPLQLGRQWVKRRIKTLLDELALAIGAESRYMRLQQTKDGLFLEVPRDPPGKVLLADLLQVAKADKMSPCHALLGLSISVTGEYLTLNIASPDVVHALVSGSSGSGKSMLLQGMALSLVRHSSSSDVRLGFIDPKDDTFRPFLRVPHALFYEIAHSDATQRLHWLSDEMDRRQEQRVVTPRLIVFIDELADVLDIGGKPAKDALRRVMQRGRSAGIHIIGCVQYANAEQLDPVVKALARVRIVGAVPGAHYAEVCAGLSGTGAERLQGRGDFILAMGGQVEHFQSGEVLPGDLPTLPPTEYSALLRQAPTSRRPAPIQSLSTGGRPPEPPRESEIQTVLAQWDATGVTPTRGWVREHCHTRDSRAGDILAECTERKSHTNIATDLPENA